MNSKNKEQMREIKFRAWDTNPLEGKSKMIYGIDEIKEFYEGIELIDELLNNIAPEIKIMQFTGLKDKNGKEIFEGDILSNGKLQSVVLWKNDGWGINNGKHKLSRYLGGNEEIIGNIYENPELLEETQ